MAFDEHLDEVFARLLTKERCLGREALSLEEAVFLRSRCAYGLLGNGGFEFFFLWEGANPAVADDFDTLGIENMAQIIRAFFELFPTVYLSGLGSQERNSLLEREYGRIAPSLIILNREIRPYLQEYKSLTNFVFSRFIAEKRL